MCKGVWCSMLKPVSVRSSEFGYCRSAWMALVEHGVSSVVMRPTASRASESWTRRREEAVWMTWSGADSVKIWLAMAW